MKSEQLRKWVIGFGSPLSMKKGDRIVFVTYSLYPFAPERLILAGRNLSCFQVRNLWIAGKSQVQGKNPIPATVFSSTSLDSLVPFRPLKKGQSIRLEIECIGMVHVERLETDLQSNEILVRKRFQRRPKISAMMIGPAKVDL